MPPRGLPLPAAISAGNASSGLLKNSRFCMLLKQVQMQGGARSEARGVPRAYVAVPRERANVIPAAG